ncbi:phage major capsid protein [Rhodococcoides kroppenstedtii]|uniref:phage major capsid protein n=1 Tax=Rhodococcoides kroppenstedtii TaxID=293050 RepID=UPI0028EB78E9|nr:phage major capsid protein [Rhodococcus kroppenstedtii]
MNKATKLVELVKADAPSEGNLEERRAKILELAQQIIAEVRGGDESDENVKSLEVAAAKVTELDQQIAAAKRSADVRAKFGGQAFDQDGQPVGTGGGSTADLPRLRLRGRAGVQAIARKMADPSGAKAIAASGDALTGVPLDGEIYEQGRVTNNALEVLPFKVRPPQYAYLRQTLRDLKAAPVAVGQLKPESKIALTQIDGKLEVIAHVSDPTPEYWLIDNSSVEGFVQTEMEYGLARAVEDQVLNGDGAGENLTGVLNTSGVVVQAFTTDATTTVRKAITKLELQGYEAGGVILNPLDWEAIELARRADGSPDLGSSIPVDRAAQRLWSLRIAVSTSVPEGTGVLFDLNALAVTGDARVRFQWSSGVSDDFARNQVRARCEGRYGLDVFRPQGIVKLDLSAA